MKANEAPEKIYIIPHTLTDGFCRRWFEEPFKIGCIEYIRKDAFIEKTEKYLQEHLLDYWSQVVTDESNFIEDFKNYMKVE